MKNIVLTGSSGGLGNAAALILSRNGYRVFGLDIKRPEGDIPYRHIDCDLTDPESVNNAFSTVREEVGTIYAIINCAGMYDLNSLVEADEDEFLKIFNVNVFSSYRVNKAFLPILEKGGRIILTSSELGPLDPLPFTGIYGITKTTVEKYAYSLRMELQLLGYRVSVLRPGAIDTGLLDVSVKRLEDFCEKTKLYSYNAERFRKIVNSVESKKIPPEKAGRMILKIVSAKNPRYIYSINRNPLLILLNIFPKSLQNRIIKTILLK